MTRNASMPFRVLKSLSRDAGLPDTIQIRTVHEDGRTDLMNGPGET
jgi:hypothetical protein